VRAWLTLLRRIGTGLMLVAMLACAVGTAWVPDAAIGRARSLADAGPAYSHMHGDGTVHSHRIEMVASLDDEGWPPFPQLDDVPQDHDHQDPTVLGLAHSVAVLPAMISAPGAETCTTHLVWPEPTRPFGMDPSGLRRPPRSLASA
jgi:hypothetical protein